MKHIESVARTNEAGTEIFGVAAVSMFSRNDNVYFPAELARNHGKTVPLNWMHEDPIRQIGQVEFSFNEEKRRLMYKGVITDARVADLVKNKELFVSIGADSANQQEVCDTDKCYSAPVGLEIFELSIVDVPGIPEVTLNVLRESFKECFTSVISHNSKNRMVETKVQSEQEVSTGEDITVKQTDAADKQPEVAKEIECKPGFHDDGNGNCVADEAPEAKAPAPEEKSKDEGCDCGKAHPEAPVANAPNQDKRDEEKTVVPNVQVDLKPLQNSLQSGLDKLATELGVVKSDQERSEQIARVSTENGSFTEKDMKYLANQWTKSLAKNGSYSWEVDLGQKEVFENFKEASPLDNLKKANRVTEALSFTQGDVSNEIGSSDIIILPGGKYDKSIRNLVTYKEIPKGADTFTLFTGTQPDEQTVTEGRTTAAAEAAQDTFTITPVDMTANTTTGYYTQITKSQIAKSPITFMKYINEVSKREAIHREAVSVFNTTVDAITTPVNWVDATDGTVLANQAAEDALTGTFDPKGISKGLELIGDLGYDPSPGETFAVITHKQYRELRDDSDLQRFVQEGKAQITEDGRLARLYGCDIIPVPSTILQTTASDTIRGVMGVKGKSFWLASGRNMSIESAKQIGKLTVDVSMDKQINSGVIDANSLAVLCSFDN